MQITQEAKTYLSSLRKYLPNPETMTYEITLVAGVVQLAPTQNKKFSDYICDETCIIAGIGPEADLQLQGRTLMVDTRTSCPKLVLEDHRRSPRLACA